MRDKGYGRLFVEAFGWYGLVAVLIAYASVSLGALPVNSMAFQLLNLTGSAGLGVLTFYRKAYPNLVLNVTWGSISMIAIMRILLGIAS